MTQEKSKTKPMQFFFFFLGGGGKRGVLWDLRKKRICNFRESKACNRYQTAYLLFPYLSAM